MTADFPRLIGLSGYARSGKDEVGRILNDYRYARVALADHVKDIALGADPFVAPGVRLSSSVEASGWHGAMAEYPEVREFLQRLASEGMRSTFGEEFWAEKAFESLDPTGMYVVTDCRFPSDAEAVHRRGGVVWRVVRPGVGPANAHVSEIALDGYRFDRTITNDGDLEDLRTEVARALLGQ